MAADLGRAVKFAAGSRFSGSEGRTLAALRGRHDELAAARRWTLQKRLWHWQWEQVFAAVNEPRPAAPLIEPEDREGCA